MASMAFPCAHMRRSRRQAPRALRERLECSEGGNTGRRTNGSCRIERIKTAVRSAPSRDQRSAPYIGISRQSASSSGARSALAFLHIALGIELFGKLHRQIDAFLDKACPLGIGGAGLAHLVEFLKQAIEVIGIKTLAE